MSLSTYQHFLEFDLFEIDLFEIEHTIKLFCWLNLENVQMEFKIQYA